MLVEVGDLVASNSAFGQSLIIAGVLAFFAALALIAGILVTLIRLRRHWSLLLMALASFVFVCLNLELDLPRGPGTALGLMVGTLTTLLPIRWFAVSRRRFEP